MSSDAPRETFLTLAAPFRYEPDKIKGSRFIASLAPAASADEAEAFLAHVRAELPDAGHHAFAWRIGTTATRFRSSDDGEPSGSAGRPILAQLEGHEVFDLCCVVSRWFGGTKLGVGGLMRAYGGTAGQALDRARLRTVVVQRALRVRHPYECSGAVTSVLVAYDLEPQDGEYGEAVAFTVRVPLARAEAFALELSDRTAGRAELEDADASVSDRDGDAFHGKRE